MAETPAPAHLTAQLVATRLHEACRSARSQVFSAAEASAVITAAEKKLQTYVDSLIQEKRTLYDPKMFELTFYANEFRGTFTFGQDDHIIGTLRDHFAGRGFKTEVNRLQTTGFGQALSVSTANITLRLA